MFKQSNQSRNQENMKQWLNPRDRRCRLQRLGWNCSNCSEMCCVSNDFAWFLSDPLIIQYDILSLWKKDIKKPAA